MTINAETARLHAETVTGRLNAFLDKLNASKIPPHMTAAAEASRAAAEAVAADLIANPTQIVEGDTAVTANPAVFDRAIAQAARDAGRAAMA